jgi:hypothetical protein
MKNLILSFVVTMITSMAVFAILLFSLIDIMGESIIIIACIASVITIVVTDRFMKNGR